MTNLESEGKSTCYILPKDIFWALSIHKYDDVIKWKQFPRYRPYGEFTVNGEFPTQMPVTRSFDDFFDLCPNKWLSEQLWGWWFETPSGPLCRHSNKSNNVQICLTRSHRMFFCVYTALHPKFWSIRILVLYLFRQCTFVDFVFASGIITLMQWSLLRYIQWPRQSIQLGLTCRWSSEQEDIQSLQDNQPHFMTEVVPWRELDSENTNQNMYIEIESLEYILNKIE